MNKSLRSLLLAAVILALGVGGFMKLKASKPQPPPIEAKETRYLVATESVQPGAYSPQLIAYGLVESPRAASLKTALEADVLDVPVREGQRVEAGQLLLALDDRDARLLLAQREAEVAEILADRRSELTRHDANKRTLEDERQLLALTEKAATRLTRLKDTRAASQSLLEESQQAVERQSIAVRKQELDIAEHPARLARIDARLAKARAQRDIAALDLERSSIKAPFSGTIASVTVAVGDRVRKGDTLISLYDSDALELRAQIPSRYESLFLKAISEGKAIDARGQLTAGDASLSLSRLSGQVRANAGGIDALFTVNSGGELMRLGTFVKLYIALPAMDGLVAIPFESVYGLDRVYVLEDGRMKAVKIQPVGEWQDASGTERILARSPALSAGAQLITTQLPNALDGLAVDAVDNSGKDA